MRPDITLGMKLGRLLLAFHGSDFGQHHPQQAQVPEQRQRIAGPVRFEQDAGQFLFDALRADARKIRGMGADRITGRGVQAEFQGCHKTHSAQYAQVVLGKTLLRPPNGADKPGIQIPAALDKVEDRIRDRVIEQSVDRKIAPTRILFKCGEMDFARTAPVHVIALAAEHGYVEQETALLHRDHAKGLADLQSPWKQGQDLVRQSAGDDVVILGRPTEDLVAHATASEIGLESGAGQATDNSYGTVPHSFVFFAFHTVLN